MASRKVPSIPAVPFTKALDPSAAGLRYKRAGFAFDDAHDVAFALGAPHLSWLVEDTADVAGKVAKSILTTQEWPSPWPRGSAARIVRAWGSFSTKMNAKGTLDVTPVGAKALEAEADEDAAAGIVEAQFTGPFPTAPDVARLVLLVEALFGSAPVLHALVSGLEALPKERLTAHEFPLREAARTAGFLLLRVPAPVATAATARLEALFSKGVGSSKLGKMRPESDNMSVVRGLDLALHGREGAERSGMRPSGSAVEPRDLLLVLDDAAWVGAEFVRGGPPTKHHQPDARVAFVGGDAALQHVAKHWKKYPSPAAVLSAYADVQSDALLPIFLEMTTLPKTKALALDWFRAHWAFAESFVRGSKSPAAKAVLAVVA